MATSASRPPSSVAPGNVVECDVQGVTPDALTVEALARLQLLARRNGCTIRLRNASAELLEVVAFMGLGATLTRS
jgi:hypothetical protein